MGNLYEEGDSSSDSEYNVDEFIKPERIRRTVNGDSADLLGNFDDEKRKAIHEGIYDVSEQGRNFSDSEDEDSEVTEMDSDSEVEESEGANINLSKDQLDVLLRGAVKTNRHVVYVTNLNFDTTKENLETYFGNVGRVKSVRIPKKRRGGYAFVEMADLEGFQHALELHNTMLQGRQIKIQISEGGKKKSANKKNILKQKNRKLAEMRNEPKTFTKSGKFYDKTLKKEKAKELLARKRWRKTPKPK